MRERKRDLKRLQRSVRVFSDMAATRPPRIYGDTHYSRMLVEDVSNGLMPFRTHGGEEINASIEPANKDAERIVSEGLGRGDYHRDLLGAVSDFLRDAVQTLLAFGEAPYELVYYSEPETDKIVGFDVSFIAPWTLKRAGRDWVQTIPKDYSRRLKTPARIELPSESVVQLCLPTPISHYFARMMKDLDVLGEDLYPHFGIPTPGSTSPDIGFEFSEWHKCHQIAMAQATKECGWSGRSLFSSHITEFYLFYRFLKFEQFKLDLRNSLLSQLNEFLPIVGNQIGFSGQVVIRGLPDAAQLEQSMRDLESGAVSFADVMKPYMRY
jgi:hypothetical protein